MPAQKSVLVVDDEVLIALDIQGQLEDLGHSAVIATSVEEAAGIVTSQPLDLAILDWHLRGEISEPLVTLLRQRSVPIIICTGSALNELARLLPAFVVVPKPFVRNELTYAVNQAFELH
jgi:CheY-like chemotaxis protein